jgi:hypothetical protein
MGLVGALVALAFGAGCLGNVGSSAGPVGDDDPAGGGADGGKTDDPDDPEVTPDGGIVTEIPQPDGPTKHSWYSDIGPLLMEKCGACHQEGASGPFPITYDQVWYRRDMVAQTTAERSMPPMPLNNDGSCQTFANARWLTDAEILSIEEWVEEGAALGKDPIELPDYPATLSLVNPNLEVNMPASFTPPMGEADNYRCFPVTPAIDTDMFVTSYEVVPGSPKIAHHMILYLVPTSDQAWVDNADANDAGPGYECGVSIGGSSGQVAQPIAIWAPGGGRIDFPAGTGVRLPKGRRLVIQMHYNLAHGGDTDLTEIHMKVSPTVAKEAFFFPLTDMNFQAPAQQELWKTTPNLELLNTNFTDGSTPMVSPMTVYGVFPHMHTKGSTMRVTYRQGDLLNNTVSQTCLADVDRWDFRWQEGWWYPEPIYLGEGLDKQLTVQCGFNTMGTNTVTKWGENTADEMCLNYLYITSPGLQNLLTGLGG